MTSKLIGCVDSKILSYLEHVDATFRMVREDGGTIQVQRTFLTCIGMSFL